RVLLKLDVLRGIESGRIEAVYRRWAQPRVKPGSTMRTAVGVVEVLSVEAVETGSLTAADVAVAGFGTVAELDSAAGNRGETLYRIPLRHVGPDPRMALRESLPDEREQAEIRRRLERLDSASSHGPWTWRTLRLIADNPGVRAEDLAHSVGREKAPFKLDVRKLKEMGLTESLETGYRISPRGWAAIKNAP
ncbi:MAG: hypothetical protein ACRDX9_08765, partial [Acidimicrobiia bacterium]